MFDVSTAFRRSIFVLVSLSATMLAIAEEAVFPNMLTVPLAVLAYAMTEQRQQWQLPPWGTNLLGLLALLLSGGEWLGGEWTINDESVMLSRLVAGTHLLIYLSWIVLFQRKSAKHYWWIFALSVLQISVGSVLTASGLYGGLLFVYLFAAIWTLSLFTLHLARNQLRRPVNRQRLSSSRSPASPPAAAKLDSRTAPGPHETDLLTNGAGTSPAAGSGVPCILQPSRVIWENNERGWREMRVDFRFVLGVVGTALASIGVAMLFFLLVPRFWIGRLPAVQAGIGSGGLSVTGFSDVVQLGSMGQILESNERVLFLRIYDENHNELDVYRHARRLGYDEPLFRGAVLGTYEDGRWIAGEMGNERDFIPRKSFSDRVITQEFRLTLSHSRYLFAMHPLVGYEMHGHEQGAGFQPFSSMLLRRGARRGNAALEYSIYSPPPPPSSSMTPRTEPPLIYLPRPMGFFRRHHRRRSRRHIEEMIHQCLQFPNDNGKLTRLRDLAYEVADYRPGRDDNPSPREMARRLESHLRDSGQYTYSLNSTIVDPDDDPVEDFLFNRKSGHCEYYAAALALMLRAVDIPSRLVNGFKGGDVNRLTGEFYVEQRHAHAWVEALIDGGWVTLDATPAMARSESVAELAPSLLSWGDLVNLIKEQWSTNFIAMDVTKQQQIFYQPLKESLAATWHSLKESGSAADSQPTSLREFFSSPRNWFSWQGGLVTAVLLLVLALIVWSIRAAWKSQKTSQAQHRRGRHVEEIRVEFYERFRALCQTLGLVRGEAQTEREFLATIDSALHARLAAAGLERLPARLVDSFYDVRFGQRPLDARLAHQLDTQLTALEQLANDARQTPSPTNGQPA